MRLHKSIRKYATFDLDKLNDLIEIDSYKLVDTVYNIFKAKKKYKILKNVCWYFNASSFAEIFKHKTDNCYMIKIASKFQITYYYVNKNFEALNRDKKPAVITLLEMSDIPDNEHVEFNINRIELSYYKNSVCHNDFGPAKLMYYKTKEKFDLIELKFLKNDNYYNKNGMVCYIDSNGIIHITFLKNDIKTYYCFDELSLSITKTTLDCKQTIVRYKNGLYTISYRCNFKSHRLSGPAYININKEKEWWINGKILPNDIIGYEKGREKDITKTDILKAMLFDREYAKFLQEKFNEQKIS